MTMTPAEVIAEMRDMAAQPQLPRDLWIYGRLNSWADALEHLREALQELEAHDAHRDPGMVAVIARDALAGKEDKS